MDGSVHFLRSYRNKIMQALSDVPAPDLFKIPTGFNNNLACNLAHVIASQQRICYILPALAPMIDEVRVSRYISGARPEASMDERE